jgi:cell division septum initiation protein DivIVA
MLHEQLVGQRGQEQLVSRTLLAAMSQAMAIREEARREAERTLRKVSEELRERSARLAQIQSEQAEAERELLRLRGLAKEMQQGLARFLSETLQQLREGISATDGDEEATIVSVLGATLGQEGRQLKPPDSETAGNPATT